MSDPLERHPQFSVVRRLAVGGMGEVLLARYVGNAQVSPGLVVVKRTIPDHPNRGHQDEMLREEGRVALRLRHANLVDTYGIEEVEGHPLLVMEYLAGRSMAQVLGAAKRKQQPVPVEVALAVLHGAACGLHFAHTLREGGTPLGLVHRDVSPANIFATFDGKVKVIDFGVAKADDSEIKTSTGILKGKLGYMSPEHAKGEKLDPRSDLWSLGVVFWEMLVADRLFGGQNPAMTLFQITQGQLDPPSKRRPDLPAEVDQLCMKLLTKDREQRIASGADLVREIERLPPALWRDADVGGSLAERFPAEAETGRREVADVARPTQARPMPQGLVEGGGDDSGEHVSPMLSAPPAAGANGPEQEAKTIAVTLEDVVEATASVAAYPQPAFARAPVTPPRPVATAAPAPSFSGPFPQPQTDPFATIGRSQPSAPGQDLSSAPLHTPLQHLGGPAARPAPAAGRWQPPVVGGAAATAPPPSTSGSVPPAPRQSGPVPTVPEPPRPISTPGSAPPAAVPPAAMPPAAAPAPASRAPDPSAPPRPPTQPSVRTRPPSSLGVALSTFGGLALVMGIAFAFLTSDRDAPAFVGYQSADGSDVVVARVDDVPPNVGQPFQVTLSDARLALEVGKAREPVNADALARELTKAGVWDRARLPSSGKQRLAAVLPLAITLLGLLSLAFALPGLLLPARRQLGVRAGGVIATVALGAGLLQLGGLGWPGLGALAEPAEVPRLAFSAPPPELDASKLPAEDRARLQSAWTAARAAVLRGQPDAALAAIAPVAELANELAAVHRLLGDAQRDLGKPSLAEAHYLRYLELSPAAPDREDIRVYLAQVQGG